MADLNMIIAEQAKDTAPLPARDLNAQELLAQNKALAKETKALRASVLWPMLDLATVHTHGVCCHSVLWPVDLGTAPVCVGLC